MTRYLVAVLLFCALVTAGRVSSQAHVSPAAPLAASDTLITDAPERGISEADRRFALQYFQATKEKLYAATAGLSEAQWRFKATAEGWSIAEIAEHIVLAEDQLYGFVTNKLMKAALPSDSKLSGLTDQQVIAATQDRSKKFSANERGLPTGRWSSREEVLKNFEQTRARTLDLIKAAPDDLRYRLAMNPAAGQPIDGFQWLLFASAHCERHLAQIQGVKAEAAYPRSAVEPEGSEAVVKHLNAAKEKFFAAVAGLSPAQLNFKPAADRWSIAEIAEHIALAETFLYETVTAILQSPAAPEKKSAVPDAAVLQLATDRTNRLQTRDSLKPTGRWGTLKETLKQFELARALTLTLVQNQRSQLRSHFGKFGSLDLDAHQWLLSLAGHSERHTAQINEVKAHPDFPKK